MWRLPFFPIKKHETLGDRVHEAKVDEELRELFIGRRTIFTLLGFILGGILFGNTLWLLMFNNLGAGLTMLIGLLLFVTAGVMTQQFRK